MKRRNLFKTLIGTALSPLIPASVIAPVVTTAAPTIAIGTRCIEDEMMRLMLVEIQAEIDREILMRMVNVVGESGEEYYTTCRRIV